MPYLITTITIYAVAIGYYITAGPPGVWLLGFLALATISFLCVFDEVRYRRHSAEIAANRLRRERTRRRAITVTTEAPRQQYALEATEHD